MIVVNDASKYYYATLFGDLYPLFTPYCYKNKSNHISASVMAKRSI